MKKYLLISVSIAVLAASNIGSYFVGLKSQSASSVTYDIKEYTPLDLKPAPPSNSLIQNACAAMYLSGEQANPSNQVRIIDLFGSWRKADSSMLCVIKSKHAEFQNGSLVREVAKQEYFQLKEQYSLNPITEDEFKDLNQE